MIIETKRLCLREMTTSDYAALAAILQDDETMYAYNGAFSDAETREWFDKMQSRYRSDGFGLWAVLPKEGGAMIGQGDADRSHHAWHSGARCRRGAFDIRAAVV